MNVLMTILYILLFIVCLSVLIVVHELGHLSMAKAFKVYCFEFSIGFGPKIFSFKRKKGETKISLRAIPFGGYVSMLGEASETPEGLNVDPSRSLNNIKKWKRAIILAAGVIMNVVLAFVVFLVSETCFMQTSISANQLVVSEDSIASASGLASDDLIYLDSETFGSDASFYIVDKNSETAYFTLKDSETEDLIKSPVVVCLYRALSSYSDVSWDDYLYYFDPAVLTDFANVSDYALEIPSNCESATFNIYKYIDTETYDTSPVSITLLAKSSASSPKKTLSSLGLSFYSHKYWNKFGTSLKNTFTLMGESSVAIFKGLGSLFTSPQNAGGIIAVGVVSTSTLQNFGFVSFLQLWGIISINLAIVNILPFPGLDGWQIFVLIFEAIARKEMNPKVKGIVSAVGIGILFLLMAVLVVKDIIVYLL